MSQGKVKSMEIDFTNLENSISKVVSFSQKFTPNKEVIHELVKTWYENKKSFIEWFGNNLIFEYGPVEFHLDKDKKDGLIKEFLEQAGNYLAMEEFENLSTFIIKNMSSFFDNTVSCDCNLAKSGMKLSKAFKYFIKDKEVLEKVQQIASMYIQKDKINGILCFSIHPLDFLSSSENTYNWRSCHSLDGDYCAGNLSYMCDNSTIMCYIKGEKEEILPHFPKDVPWNSKKWRMLITFDENQDYCFLGRQYPYTLEEIYDLISNFLLPGQFTPFTDFYIDKTPSGHLEHKYISLNSYSGIKLVPLEEIIEDEKYSLQYNDLLFSTVYTPYYASRSFGYSNINFPKIKVGKKVNCLYCGKHRIEAGERSMACPTCSHRLGIASSDDILCYSCGCVIEDEDFRYITHSGESICIDCAENYYTTCSNCCELYPNDSNLLTYSYKYDGWFCPSCYEDIQYEEENYRKAHKITED